MENSSKRVMLVTSCILLVSFALANSSAKCPADVVLRLDSCSNLANALIGGGSKPTEKQCCSVLNGLNSQLAADCLCVVLNGDLGGKKVDDTLKRVFFTCHKPLPASYPCRKSP